MTRTSLLRPPGLDHEAAVALCGRAGGAGVGGLLVPGGAWLDCTFVAAAAAALVAHAAVRLWQFHSDYHHRAAVVHVAALPQVAARSGVGVAAVARVAPAVVWVSLAARLDDTGEGEVLEAAALRAPG